MKYLLTGAALAGCLAFPALADGVISGKSLSLGLADKLAQQTIMACSAKGYQVSVTVLDRAGIPLVIKKMDNAGPHTVKASRMKAYTALSTKNPTENVMKAAQDNPAAANLRSIPGFLLLGGGVPVKVGTDTIGAIGVGGAPGGHLDQQCATDALAASAAALKA
ncbi:heme-binding protein [Shimwellia pseudoproteus]|uniref:GlcG/HbpS family heme-binding protein n=1 Tax=Shimwellia pseudoproteus TaxID=570012 RepID=UPI0018EB92FD|nr:heme-binding protein [Shimwellia pseudoproteus]MBJ3816143.1 heme-binding protein [Shimwellia pseudoproteus]